MYTKHDIHGAPLGEPPHTKADQEDQHHCVGTLASHTSTNACPTAASPRKSPVSGIDLAIATAGGAAALAKVLNVTHQAVYLWGKRGWVPSVRALQIEELFSVPRIALVNPRLVPLIVDQRALELT